MARKTLAEQGAAERRKRDQQVTSAQGGTTRAGRRSNTGTAQTARQRGAVAKRKIASQVSSAPGGRTKPKESYAEIGKALLKMGESILASPGAFATAKLSPSARAAVSVLTGQTYRKPKPKSRNGSPVTPPAAKALERSRPKPAAAKPKQTTVHLGAITPRRKPKRKAPTYRG